MHVLSATGGSKGTTSRNRWFSVILFRNGHHQMHIVRKTHDGTVKMFSTTPQCKAGKSPWGCIQDCQFPVLANSGEECYGIQNRQGESAAFRKSQLDPSLWKICSFTQMWMRLRSENKDEKLSKLVKMMVSSKPFTANPNDGDFNSDGLNVKYEGLPATEKKEFIEFLSSAISASMGEESLDKVPGLCNVYKKRKIPDDDENTKKMRLTKSEEIKKVKMCELDDRDGVEANVQRSMKFRKMVSIDKLQNSPQLEKESPLSPARVKHLATKMTESFDLSQITLTVCPEESENIFSENDDQVKYVVISGRARLAALKLLDEELKLVDLKGCEEREILCVVLDITNRGVQSYVHNRANKIQADIVGFRPENLIDTLATLREIEQDETEAAETIRRYAVNQELAPEEVNVLKKLAHWPLQNIVDLSEMIQAFKTFSTKDVEEKGNRLGRILTSGQQLPINKLLFRKLGRLTAQQAGAMKAAVLGKQISFSEAVENGMKEHDRHKTIILAAQLLGNIPTDEVLRVHGDKFPDNLLDSFRGAVLGKKGNLIGQQLEEYCDEILVGKQNTSEPKVEVNIVNDGFALKGAIDVAVITCTKPETSANKILETVDYLKKTNAVFGLVVVSKNNVGLEDLKVKLEEKMIEKISDIYFAQEKGNVKDGFENNIVYGLAAGKVFDRPVKKINGDIQENLRKVVKSLSPPESRVAIFHMSTQIPISLIHTSDTKKADYFIVKKDEQELWRKLKNNGVNEIHENNIAKENQSNTIPEGSVKKENVHNEVEPKENFSDGELTGQNQSPSTQGSDGEGRKYSS